jgi:hypothetical protein
MRISTTCAGITSTSFPIIRPPLPARQVSTATRAGNSYPDLRYGARTPTPRSTGNGTLGTQTHRRPRKREGRDASQAGDRTSTNDIHHHLRLLALPPHLEQSAIDWQQWYNSTPQPMTYAAPHRCRLDAAYTTLLRKISSMLLGLCTGHGYFLDCLACHPLYRYPSQHCGCPLHPPQIPKHLLLSCPDFRDQRMTLRQDLKLHRNASLNVLTILHTPSGTKAFSDYISATKIATAEWARTRISIIRAAEDKLTSLTIGWGTLLENCEDHEDEQGDED